MIRRAVVVLVAALGLVVVPLPAAAYDAPPYATTVSDSSPTAGTPFTVTTAGIGCCVMGLMTWCGNATLTVTSASASTSDDAIAIAGTKSLTKGAQFDFASGGQCWMGAVVWTVTLAEAGTYTLTVVHSQTGAFMSELTVVVGARTGGEPSDGGDLGDTGFDVLLVLEVAGALVVAGVLAVWLARRREVGGPGR